MTVLRCAIYTRVSSDSGLEQHFNSLDAQRESAEAYIKSQTHEAWKLVRERFDDGGFSGGSMERPALQKLMDRIRDRRIEIVVVYKVDRLTRSLAGFAKLVDLFDAHGVSFVSVTQSFNTTSSMGRLTLNVLLSFAQYEREVTGERIRDKIAASKRRGIWMGSHVAFGHRVDNRKLLVVEEEADIVRLIFDLYLAHGSMRILQRELRARNIRTRERVLANGKAIGGVHFTNGPLAHILTNRLYVGEIGHKGQFHPGEHAAIVDRDIFDRVQQKLAEQCRSRLADREQSRALLLGRIFNQTGERMTPTYAVKKGVRYRYYISVSAMQSRERSSDDVHRIPAAAIDALVLEAITRGGSNATALAASAQTLDPHLDPEAIAAKYDLANHPAAAADIINRRVERIIVHSNRIEIARRSRDETDGTCEPLIVPWRKPTQTRLREIIQPVDSAVLPRPMQGEEQSRLLRGIAAGRRWLQELVDGVVPDLRAIAIREARSQRSIRMTLSLAFLDPALIRAAIEGRLPRGYGATRLTELPARFEDQWAVLGLTPPL